VEGLGGECFVGEMPVTAGGKAAAWPASRSCCSGTPTCSIGGDKDCRGDDFVRWGLDAVLKAGLRDTGTLLPEYPLSLDAKTGALESGDGRFTELRR